MSIKNFLPRVKENAPLEKYTSFRIGGRAKYFFEAKNEKEIIKAIVAAKKLNLPFFVLGGGSNLLVSDKGFNGLVLKVHNTCLTGRQAKYIIHNTKIVAGAGVPLARLVADAAKKGLTGLEWAAGIPGTIGGAIYGNAGTPEESIGGIVKEVEIFDSGILEAKKIKNKDCGFSYRESVFKKQKNLIVLSAELQLKKGNIKKIKEKMEKLLAERRYRQPLNFPSAGSIFKNPSGFFAGRLIEECGLKGKKIGGAKISEKHANFILNLGSGRSGDVLKLINSAKKSVKNKFGVSLQEEIQYLGF